MIIDVHSHFYPKPYLKELLRGRYKTRIHQQSNGELRVDYTGDYNIVARGHIDLEYRLKEMKRYSIQMHVISLTTPGVHIENPDESVKLARIVNDHFSEIAVKNGDHIRAFATLPMSNPDESVDEVKRAVDELGLSGFMVFSNINGKPLDSPGFFPVLREIARSGRPLMIHPTNPPNGQNLLDYRLTALIGFPFETTTAAARLIFSRTLDRLVDLKVILAHLGGALPYVVERLDRGYRAYSECKGIRKEPSKYLNNFYFDTVSFYPPALRLALEFAGPERILFGTDYPHQIGDPAHALRAIKSLKLDVEKEKSIFAGNTAKLLGIEA